jgi:hypothetical protein
MDVLIRKSVESWDILVPTLDRYKEGIDPRADAKKVLACLKKARLSTDGDLEPDTAMPDYYVIKVHSEGIERTVRWDIEAALESQLKDQIRLFPRTEHKSGRNLDPRS